MSEKPTIFIASSTEAIPLAEAVHIKLEDELKVRLWTNAFDLSSITITTLIGKTKEADYAVFVFHPDDKVFIRNNEYSSVRDNVVLELGMFIGALGIEKCFILVPNSSRDKFRLPTDLAGVTVSPYNDKEPDVIDAITGNCARIKQSVRKLEATKTKTEATSETENLKSLLHQAQSQIWSMSHDSQRAQELSSNLLEAIRNHFFSVAQPATPAEIKEWEDGAKLSHLKEIKIEPYNIHFVNKDVIIPPFTGAHSVSIIVAPGVKVFGLNIYNHNRIYYMDGFRTNREV
ncbi:TIR domain-containing protein [Enterobacter sichuanensis]|uniref:Nucleotide-binding protein n=1 Tax=Enterobacter sichuanensis TaxID=2071710 RepID=A0ABS6G9P9_9ENTR|nr:nucleotide-binding protein [Enterobacter sichuanensis]MBU5923532.1 nucleotide-binding protein [Enterobacter sichuanensis]OZV00931.1 nucleotide-binding protein [Enterobacter cloacae]PAO14231.1 nucleotide-binding protein [Enterobacter cloacae]